MVTGALRRLVQNGLIDMDAAAEANETARKQKIPLFTYLTDNNLVDAAELCDAASNEYGVPALDVSALDMATLPKGLVSES